MTRLTPVQVEKRLADLPGWKREDDFIAKSFRFKKFMDGIAFVEAVALIAERLEHHPDIHIVWTTVTLKIQTHDEGGITTYDFQLAREVEKKLGQKNLKVKKR